MSYERAKVYSIESSTIIRKKHIPEIIRLLKIYHPKNEGLQKALGIWRAMRAFGWSPKLNSDGDIVSLNYRNNEWSIKAITFLGVIGRFIEAGGYIKLADETLRRYWVYEFDGFKGLSRNIDYRIIDFENEKDLRKYFDELVQAMLNLGITKMNLIRAIKMQFVKKVLK